MKVSNEGVIALLALLLVITIISTASILGRPTIMVNADIAGDVTTYIGTDTTVTLPNSTVNFGNITQGSTNDTVDNIPWPFNVQNDGSVKVNLTIYASNLWTDVLGYNPSNYYEFLADKAGEGGAGYCFNGNASASNVTLTQMPPAPGGLLGMLESVDICDTARIDISITAPSDEPAGGKSSTVTVTASLG